MLVFKLGTHIYTDIITQYIYFSNIKCGKDYLFQHMSDWDQNAFFQQHTFSSWYMINDVMCAQLHVTLAVLVALIIGHL